MGTDIHISWQYKKNGIWEIIPFIKDSSGRNCLQFRNYDNFSLLAGVRNGYGFAGVKIGEPVIPIAEGRGFPKDMGGIFDDTTYYDEYEISLLYRGYIYGKFGITAVNDYLGDHSFTWMTLQDIIDYPYWNTKRTHFGCIYKDWCDFEEEKERIYKESYIKIIDENDEYITYSWETDLKESYIYKEVIPSMKSAATEYNVAYNEIRMVIGFDN